MTTDESARDPGDPQDARLSLDYIAGLQKCRIRVRPDLALGAVELEVVASSGTASCLLAPPSVYKLAAALLQAVAEIGPEEAS